jgi:hypothetical protein
MAYSRLPKNVPGPFYTTGECLACEMPEKEAPTLLAPLDDQNSDSYFTTQPAFAVGVNAVAVLRFIDAGGVEESALRISNGRSR